ncbi:MAG: hypothetical protein ACRBCL_03085 [Maritimibacter sp.]
MSDKLRPDVTPAIRQALYGTAVLMFLAFFAGLMLVPWAGIFLVWLAFAVVFVVGRLPKGLPPLKDLARSLGGQGIVVAVLFFIGNAIGGAVFGTPPLPMVAVIGIGVLLWLASLFFTQRAVAGAGQ